MRVIRISALFLFVVFLLPLLTAGCGKTETAQDEEAETGTAEGGETETEAAEDEDAETETAENAETEEAETDGFLALISDYDDEEEWSLTDTFTGTKIVEVYEYESIDFSEPPPGYEAEDEEEVTGENTYEKEWETYLEDAAVVQINGYFVMLNCDPPNLDEYDLGHTWTIDYLDKWCEYLTGDDCDVEEDILDLSTIDFSEAPPSDSSYSEYDVEEGSTAYMNQWLAYLKGTTILWDGWILDTKYPPPDYDITEDPLYLKRLANGSTEDTASTSVAKVRSSYGYGDCWREFFEIADVWVIVG